MMQNHTYPKRSAPPAPRYFVALVENGIPRFSARPVAHPGYRSAAAEADRLARKFPGKTFNVYGEAARPHFVAPPRKRWVVEVAADPKGVIVYRKFPAGKRTPHAIGDAVSTPGFSGKVIAVTEIEAEA